MFGKWPSQLVPFPCCIRRISLAAAAAVALSSHVSTSCFLVESGPVY